MGDRRMAKDELYEGFAHVAKALGNGRRVELIDVLEQGERHVEQLAAELEQSVPNTSFHLRALAAAGLVATRRDGNRIFYRLTSGRVTELWSALRDVTEAHFDQLADLADAYLGDRSALQEIDRNELARRLHEGDVIVIDVRPEPEYRAGHIAGARSIPSQELQRRMTDIPAGTDVVAYCRGPFCVYADDAVRELERAGHRARRLVDGFPQWRDANLEIEQG